MIKKAKNIYEGWRNLLFPPEKLKEEIIVVGNERLAICRECPYHSLGEGKDITILSTCKSCGCQLQAKTACLSCSCPLNKWTSVLTKIQESKIKEKLNETPNSV